MELDLLKKCKIFGFIVKTPNNVTPVGYKWVFVRKRNKRNEIQCYKAILIAQDFRRDLTLIMTKLRVHLARLFFSLKAHSES